MALAGVFSYPSTGYYKFNLNSSSEIVDLFCSSSGTLDHNLQGSFNSLYSKINQDSSINNVLNGPALPFSIKKNTLSDIGSILESDLLPSLNTSFLNSHPEAHFKVVTQDKQHLAQRLFSSVGCGYEQFLTAINNSDVIGFYFPSAFPEFSISSQRDAFKSISSSLDISVAIVPISYPFSKGMFTL